MFSCKEIFFWKFSHSAFEYWDTFLTFKPKMEEGKEQPGGGGSLGTKKNFFAFLDDSGHVLILVFESGKKCRKGRPPPPQVGKFPLFFNEPFP